jgi:tetratricopeptide (TPR) repeat protein
VRHWYRGIDDLPSWVLEEFAVASWESLEEQSLFPRAAHLIDLGKLERRNGAYERSIEALTLALEVGGDDLRRAEAHFHLGLALMALDRRSEALRELETAGEHPVFLPSVLIQLGADAERTGNDKAALEHYRRLRWESPKDLNYCMRFATVARRLEDWPAALEALRWAKQTHSREWQPFAATVETYIDKGDLASARLALAEIEDWPEQAAEVDRLRRMLVRAAASSG